MPSSTRRALTAVATVIAAVGPIGLMLVASSCDARRHVAPAASVITVPGPEQVTRTIDTSGMDWLSRYVGKEPGSGTAGR
jgi:hypothetical protein